jgi:hypothetical protein
MLNLDLVRQIVWALPDDIVIECLANLEPDEREELTARMSAADILGPLPRLLQEARDWAEQQAPVPNEDAAIRGMMDLIRDPDPAANEVERVMAEARAEERLRRGLDADDRLPEGAGRDDDRGPPEAPDDDIPGPPEDLHPDDIPGPPDGPPPGDDIPPPADPAPGEP